MNSIDSSQTVHLYLPSVSSPLAQPRVLIDTQELCVIMAIVTLLTLNLLIPTIMLALQVLFITALLVSYLVHCLQMPPVIPDYGTTT